MDGHVANYIDSNPMLDEAVEAPPIVRFDERRMHIRAYNYWASLLGDRNLPSIEDLNPAEIEDFGSHSVLLDFTGGIDDPTIAFLGSALAAQCDVEKTISRASHIPPRTLLSRLTDHYLQIIANAAPIGFEAEFTNQRGNEILYRGIMMPFSSDDDTIDFVYGVINWKEVVSEEMTEAIAAEVEAEEARHPTPLAPVAGPVWDIPGETADQAADAEHEATDAEPSTPHLEEANAAPSETAEAVDTAQPATEVVLVNEDFEAEAAATVAAESVAPAVLETDPEPLDLSSFEEIEETEEIEADEAPLATALPADSSLDDCLAAAREAAAAATASEGRTRQALYRAIGLAHAFALTAQARPEDYAEILEESGFEASPRKPMTTLVKLIFGTSYDKTRLAEFVCAIDYGLDHGFEPGGLTEHLLERPGGLKALVKQVRAERRGDKPARPARSVVLARRRLSKADALAPETLATDENGLAVVVLRREEDGSFVPVASLAEDEALTGRVLSAAAKHL